MAGKLEQIRALREAKFAVQQKEAPVANIGVSHAVSHDDVANTKTTYRYRDPDKRRAYQRDLMRKRRASVK